MWRTWSNLRWCRAYDVVTARKRSLRRLCFYRCLSFCPQRGACVVAPGGMRGCSGGCAWLLWGGMRGCSRGGVWLLWGGMCGCSQGGMHGCSRGGHAWLLPGGCAWLLQGDMRGCSGGACMVALEGWGGMRGCSGGHVWLLWRGGGACVVAWWGVCGFFDEIRSMSGRYASYWNAVLLIRNFELRFWWMNCVNVKCGINV